MVGGSCYLAAQQRVDWATARQVGGEEDNWLPQQVLIVQFCTDNGGYLAEISSSEEENSLNNFLTTAGLQDHWIGLNDIDNEGEKLSVLE